MKQVTSVILSTKCEQICQTNTQYTLITICFLQHCYMFRYLHIILRDSLIMYAKVKKLTKLETVIQVV
jgi:hypothetical protein